MQNLMAIGVYIWGAIYAVGVIAAALVLGSHITLYLALASAGAAYFAQFAGFLVFDEGNDERLVTVAWWTNVSATLASICLAIAAGVALILGA